MHIVKKIWGVLVALLCVVQLSAQQSGSAPKYSFVVWFHDGGQVSFPFEEHPVLTYSDGDIVVTTSKEQLSYARALVHKFTLTNENIPQGGESTEIATVEREAQWQFQGDAMLLSAYTPGERVAVYSATGLLMAEYVISSEGTLQSPLQQFEEGTYIVKTQSTIYKFLKK